MKYHAVVTLFPAIEGDDFLEMEKDMKKNGFDPAFPITTTKIGGETVLVDGRNRLEMAQRLGIEPAWNNIDFESEEAIFAFALRANLSRRHLNASQKAGVAVKILPYYKKQAAERMKAGGGDKKSESYKESGSTPGVLPDSGKAIEQAAAVVGASRDLVQAAAKAAEKDPSIPDKLISGELRVRSVTEPDGKKKLYVAKQPPPISKGRIEKREQNKASRLVDKLPSDLTDNMKKVIGKDWPRYARMHAVLPPEFRAEADSMIMDGKRVAYNVHRNAIHLGQFVPELADNAVEFFVEKGCFEIAKWRKIAEEPQQVLHRSKAQDLLNGRPLDRDGVAKHAVQQSGWIITPAAGWEVFTGNDPEGREIYGFIRDILAFSDFCGSRGKQWNDPEVWQARRQMLEGLGKTIGAGKLGNISRWETALKACGNTKVPA